MYELRKEEKIKHVYNELEIKQNLFPDKHGWTVYSGELTESIKKVVDYKSELCTDVKENDSTRLLIRPKSLNGIENNLGWIETDKQSILLNDWHDVYVFNGTIQYATYNPHKEYFKGVDGLIIENVTHYQLIKKPQPPIY